MIPSGWNGQESIDVVNAILEEKDESAVDVVILKRIGIESTAQFVLSSCQDPCLEVVVRMIEYEVLAQIYVPSGR